MISNFQRKRVPEQWARDTKTLRAHFNCSEFEAPQGHRGWQTCGLGEPDGPQLSTATRSNRTGHRREDIWRWGCRVWIRFFGKPGASVECSQYLRKLDRIFIFSWRGELRTEELIAFSPALPGYLYKCSGVVRAPQAPWPWGLRCRRDSPGARQEEVVAVTPWPGAQTICLRGPENRCYATVQIIIKLANKLIDRLFYHQNCSIHSLGSRILFTKFVLSLAVIIHVLVWWTWK